MIKSTKKLPIPPKPRRPRDPNMRMASIMQDVIAISEKPIVSPPQPKKPNGGSR